MERTEFVRILTPLVSAMRTPFDKATWAAYYRALEDVSAPVLSLTVDVLIREPLTFFPKAGELRAVCERQRRALLAAYPHEACCECEQSKGWRTVTIDGVPRAERCPCLERHRSHLRSLGLAEPLVALPGESGAGDEAVYPTLEQLPAPIQARLREVAAQKLLR